MDNERLVASLLLDQFKFHFRQAGCETPGYSLCPTRQRGKLATAAAAAAAQEDENDPYSSCTSGNTLQLTSSPMIKKWTDYLAAKATSVQSLRDYTMIAKALD